MIKVLTRLRLSVQTPELPKTMNYAVHVHKDGESETKFDYVHA